MIAAGEPPGPGAITDKCSRSFLQWPAKHPFYTTCFSIPMHGILLFAARNFGHRCMRFVFVREAFRYAGQGCELRGLG